MDVRVENKGLRPGVKDGHGAWRGPHPLPTHVMERFYRRLEEEGVALWPVGEQASVDRRGHGENDMEVRHRQEVASLRLDPACLIEALTLGTVAVPARVVEGSLAAALVAHLEVAAQGGGPTIHDVADHSTALRPEMVERWGVCAKDLGQVGRAARRGRQATTPAVLLQRIQWAARLAQIVAGHVHVALCGAQTAMPQQGLDRSDVHAGL